MGCNILGQKMDNTSFTNRRPRHMKTINILAIVLLVVGGLNWGLVGTTGFDLVRALFGDMTLLSRVVYTLVGAAAVYQLFNLGSATSRSSVRA